MGPFNKGKCVEGSVMYCHKCGDGVAKNRHLNTVSGDGVLCPVCYIEAVTDGAYTARYYAAKDYENCEDWAFERSASGSVYHRDLGCSYITNDKTGHSTTGTQKVVYIRPLHEARSGDRTACTLCGGDGE